MDSLWNISSGQSLKKSIDDSVREIHEANRRIAADQAKIRELQKLITSKKASLKSLV